MGTLIPGSNWRALSVVMREKLSPSGRREFVANPVAVARRPLFGHAPHGQISHGEQPPLLYEGAPHHEGNRRDQTYRQHIHQRPAGAVAFPPAAGTRGTPGCNITMATSAPANTSSEIVIIAALIFPWRLMRTGRGAAFRRSFYISWPSLWLGAVIGVPPRLRRDHRRDVRRPEPEAPTRTLPRMTTATRIAGTIATAPSSPRMGNFRVSDEDPNDQRRVKHDHQHRQQSQKEPSLLFRRLAIPPALRAKRFAQRARRRHSALRTFGRWHGVNISRFRPAAQNPSYDVPVPALIELRGMTVELPTPAGWIRPVDDVSFTLESGASLGLVGESGSGKSMLALALMGLLPPGAKVRGEAWLAGANGASESRVNLLTLPERERIGIRGRDIAMIFQEPMTALNPVMRVGAQIAEAVRAHHPGQTREEVSRQVIAALERAAVLEPALRARQYPHQLSGGLRQRAMIAMALAAGVRW